MTGTRGRTRGAPSSPGRAGLPDAALWPALCLLVLLPAPARAQEARYYREGRFLVHELTGIIPATALRIRVESDVGSVSAKAGQAPEVRYTIRVRAAARDEAEARRLLEAFQVSASQSGDLLLFKGLATRPLADRGVSAEFDLIVPEGTPELEVLSGAGGVEARGIAGRATLSTRGGGITADRLGGPLRAETRGGNIDVGSVRSAARLITGGGGVRLVSGDGEVVVQTSGGDVFIGRAAGLVRAETGGGNISVESSGGDISAQTSGGNITLGKIAGEVNAATGGGSIRVDRSGGRVRCETASGPIHLRDVSGPIRAVTSAGSIRADLRAAGRILFDSDIQTWQGDVTVSLPETMPLTIRAVVENSTGRRIRSEFPLRLLREAEDTGRPVETAEGEIGGGGSLLRIRTFDGDIVILKAKDSHP
jgi:DUF4097 and DUF4098 domain-containing protein YvlB